MSEGVQFHLEVEPALSRFAISQATRHAANSSRRAVDIGAGLAAVVAPQPRVGILSERRPGTGFVDRADFVLNGQNLKHAAR